MNTFRRLALLCLFGLPAVWYAAPSAAQMATNYLVMVQNFGMQSNSLREVDLQGEYWYASPQTLFVNPVQKITAYDYPQITNGGVVFSNMLSGVPYKLTIQWQGRWGGGFYSTNFMAPTNAAGPGGAVNVAQWVGQYVSPTNFMYPFPSSNSFTLGYPVSGTNGSALVFVIGLDAAGNAATNVFTGAGGGSATNVFFISGTNTYWTQIGGSNQFNFTGPLTSNQISSVNAGQVYDGQKGSTATNSFDAINAALNATNQLGGLAFLSSLTSNLLSGKINLGQIFSGGSILTNKSANPTLNGVTVNGSITWVNGGSGPVITGGAGDGPYAVDLSGSSIASGYASVVVNDHGNASGQYDFVSGNGNTASNSASACLGGNGNYATGQGSATIGGQNSLASGNGSVALGGYAINNALFEATNTGSVVYGYAGSNTDSQSFDGFSGNIVSGGQGSLAGGFVYETNSEFFSSIMANGDGSVALGVADSSQSGQLLASGFASVAIGDSVQALANNSYALGSFQTNAAANTLMIGWNGKPALIITTNGPVGSAAGFTNLPATSVIGTGSSGGGTNVAMEIPFEINPYQFGGNLSTNDNSRAFQAMFSTANAGNHGAGYRVYIPQGDWHFTNTVWLTNVYSCVIEGSGKAGTRLIADFAGPVISTWGFQYSTVRNLDFVQTVANPGGAIFDIEGGSPNYPSGPNYIGVQANTLDGCFFEGNNNADFGLKVNGGNYNNGMGSENLFLNLHFIACNVAGYYQNSQNALDNNFIGGDCQGCTNNGLYAKGGTFHVHGMSFENGIQTQVGFDIYLVNSSYEPVVISGCRSEGMHGVYSATPLTSIDGFETKPAISAWAANTVYSPSNLVAQSPDSGIAWRCITGGTSSNTQPSWVFLPYASGQKTITEGTGVVWNQVNDYAIVQTGNGNLSLCNSAIQYCLAGASSYSGQNWFTRPDFPGTVSTKASLIGKNSVTSGGIGSGTNQNYTFNINSLHYGFFDPMQAQNMIDLGPNSALTFGYNESVNTDGNVKVGFMPRNDGAVVEFNSTYPPINYSSGTYTNDTTENSLQMWGSLSKPRQYFQLGWDLDFVGGIGTNTVGGGAINWWTQPPGYNFPLKQMSLATNGTLTVTNAISVGNGSQTTIASNTITTKYITATGGTNVTQTVTALTVSNLLIGSYAIAGPPTTPSTINFVGGSYLTEPESGVNQTLTAFGNSGLILNGNGKGVSFTDQITGATTNAGSANFAAPVTNWNGLVIAGGTITGNAVGLTNLPAAGVVGIALTNVTASAASTNIPGTDSSGHQVTVPWSGLPAGGSSTANTVQTNASGFVTINSLAATNIISPTGGQFTGNGAGLTNLTTFAFLSGTIANSSIGTAAALYYSYPNAQGVSAVNTSAAEALLPPGVYNADTLFYRSGSFPVNTNVTAALFTNAIGTTPTYCTGLTLVGPGVFGGNATNGSVSFTIPAGCYGIMEWTNTSGGTMTGQYFGFCFYNSNSVVHQ